jgi:putative ABC transport system ATP-binding protein
VNQVALFGALEIGLIYGLVALGVFLSFRVLSFPDLTVDGSFPLGAAVTASAIVAGVDPYLATLLAILAGALAGLVTAVLNVRFRILHLLASILTMIALFSINLRIMGRPNIALIAEPTVLTPFEGLGVAAMLLKPLVVGVLLAAVVALLASFLVSEYGLAMRATGANPRMARAQGIATGQTVYVGMALSNALVALAGALFAQTNGFADITIGTGTIVVGLAAVIRRRDDPAGAADLAGGARLRAGLDSLPPRGRLRPQRRRARARGLGPQPRDRGPGRSRPDPAGRAQSDEGAGGAPRPGMIEVQGLGVTFARGTVLETRALADVDLAIPPGQFVTVIGSNGAGKSTLLNALTGDVRPDRGRVLIDGQDVTGWPAPARARLIARVFQDPLAGSCEALSIEENLALAAARGRVRGLAPALNRQLREHLRARLARLGLGLDRRLGDRMGLLSGGQRQAVSLLMATLAPMKILLLDEHTAALDPKTAEFVLELTREIVAEQQLTTLMVTHSMRQALDCGTRTIMLHEGRICFDVAGERRAGLDVPDLVAMFAEVRGARLDDDSLLLA